MADEYVELVCQLWDSWEPDAVVLDRETGTYADYTKVHTDRLRGQVLQVPRAAQHGALAAGPARPSCRPAARRGAASSPRSTADSHHRASVNGIEGMKAYRDDVRARAGASGRNPDDIKVLFLVAPVLGETEEEARAKIERDPQRAALSSNRRWRASRRSPTSTSRSSTSTSRCPELTTNGEQGSLDKFAQWGSGKTLRQLVIEPAARAASVELVGTPEQVAEQMGEVMEEVGGDGFLITRPHATFVSRSTSPRSATGWFRRCSVAAWCAPNTPRAPCARRCASSDSARIRKNAAARP